MKVKKVQVVINTEKQFWQDFQSRLEEFATTAQTGKTIKSRPDRVVFSSLTEMAQVLTPRRLELVGLIGRHQPESVRELAALAGRDIKNVSQDVRLLERYGFIELAAGRGSRKRPTADYARLDVQVYF